MDKFDEKIIGYESTKNILRQILDTLKRPELYKSKGASIPRGLLMESAPGLGKSLLASVFIKESGRKSLVFRKTSQENSFLDELRAAFLAAKEAAPSILLLEDLNLYVESNSPYAPEWACLQACIDDARNTDIFVIATTNDTKYMPPSLLRPGRFDYTLYLDPPMGKIAERIVSYYLRDKDLAEDVLISDIVKAMPKVSCATLETVMNLAALNSTYQGHEHIYKDDVTDALLQVVYRLSKTDKSLDLTECQKIALHEAAHAVVGEILNPDSIGIVTIHVYHNRLGAVVTDIAQLEQEEYEKQKRAIEATNTTQIKKLYTIKQKLENAKTHAEFDKLLQEISAVDAEIDHDNLTSEQKTHYDQLNKSCTDTISAKMRQLEYKDNIDYNKKAVNAYNSAFTSFKNNESRYKDKSQLFGLVSTTLFAYDAGRLFNETLIFYNHVYSYIFNKLDDNGKLELTKYSIECERKQG